MPPPIHVLCAADLHLGVISSGLFPAACEPSTVGAWNRIVDAALSRRADLVALAGDVFDNETTYLEVADAFAKGLKRLEGAGVPVVAVAGNHDFAALRRFARTRATPGFHLLGTDGAASRWTELELSTKCGPVRIVGWSFSAPEERTRPYASFPFAAATLPTLGLLHGDEAAQTRYGPLDRSRLRLLPVDVWVLGHVHKPELPAPDEKPCFYPGSPQALDFGPGEWGSHGAVLLTLAAHHQAEFLPISNVRYTEMSVDLTADADLDTAELQVFRQVQQELENIRNKHATPSLTSIQTRVHLAGESLIPWATLRERFPEAPRLTDLDAIAFPWLEPLPPLDREAAAATPDALGFAVRLLQELETSPPGPWAHDVLVQACDRARLAWRLSGVEAAAREVGAEEIPTLDVESVQSKLTFQCRRLISALRTQHEREGNP